MTSLVIIPKSQTTSEEGRGRKIRKEREEEGAEGMTPPFQK
jgi:hypothetical protein